MANKLTAQRTREVSIGRWFYTKPDLVPNQDGNTVLILKMSFGPLETFEWGIDSNKNAYERYRWIENDFYEDTSYDITIEREALLEQIYFVISLFRENGLPEWADFYESVIVYLNEEQTV